MKEEKLVKIFFDVYNRCYTDLYHKNAPTLNIGSLEDFEKVLEEYINKVLGNRIRHDYNLYYREIKTAFENVIINAKFTDLANIKAFILSYGNSFWEKINERYISSIFINTMRRIYSSDIYGVSIGNKENYYTIKRIARKEEDGIPDIIIKNIDSFEEVLNKFVESVKITDTCFNRFFEGMEEEEAISYLLEWTIKNAGFLDLMDIEKYYKKYTDFIIDTTFDKFKKPVFVDNFLGDELYIMKKKANVNYETPYYISFIMKNNNSFVELPNIRLGIENQDGKKVAHILATQSSQINTDHERNAKLDEMFKKMMEKSKYFREFNPSHIISLSLAFGLLKGLGINEIKITDYLPLRFQRLLLENQKGTEEIERLQYRLTNKNLNNYLRLCEYFNGIEIMSYPDMDGYLSMKINDSVDSTSILLQKLYNIGYTAGINNRYNQFDNEKNNRK